MVDTTSIEPIGDFCLVWFTQNFPLIVMYPLSFSSS